MREVAGRVGAGRFGAMSETASGDETNPLEDDGGDGGLRSWWWLDFALPIVVLLIGTLVCWSGEVDLALQERHFQDGSWATNAEPWKALYTYGIIPTALLTLACIIALPLSYRTPRVRGFRAPVIFFLGVMAIGPGLITNAILKDNWDRPRPRKVENFDGRYAFEPVLRRDDTSRGKSFPCGHGAAVFALAAAVFVLRERKASRPYAWVLYPVAVGLGAATCYARMVQGGHFFSDGIWAYGIVLLTASSLYWILRLVVRKAPLFSSAGAGSADLGALPLPVKILTAALGVGFFATFFLAIPYSASFDMSPIEPATSRPLPLRFILDLPNGDVSVQSGKQVRWTSEATGHGYAGSRLADTWTEKMEDDGAGGESRSFSYSQRKSGFYSELSQEGKLELPIPLLRRLRVETEDGDVELHIPSRSELPDKSEWIVSGDVRELVLVIYGDGEEIPDFEIRDIDAAPEGSEGLMRDYDGGIWRAGGVPQLVIKNETKGARIRLVRKAAYAK